MKRAYNLAQRYVIEHSRFGIPMLLSTECPHGHQALDGYLLPVNLAMGAAWNPELVAAAYKVCGTQLRELGVDYALISMLDVLRDPRWGRSEECYSEDPFLASALAGKAVEGCREAGVAVVAKHFCAQGETTGGVNASAARIGGRELREIHLPPVRACCQAGVEGFMAAYNEIDGVFCHSNRELLQKILREEMGFTGIVMADGQAVDRLDSLTGSPAASGAMALKAGVGISLWDQAFAHLDEAVERGLVSEAEIDQAVLRVLELKFSRGLFDHPYLDETPPKQFGYAEFPESLELSRQSPVLLKNQSVLPLKPDIKIAVIGPNAHSIYNQLGDYTPAQRHGQGVTPLQGLQALRGEEAVQYAQGCTVCGTDTRGIPAAVKLAQECDVAVLVLGGSSSRFAGAQFDTNGAAVANGPVEMDCGEGIDAHDLSLPGVQKQLAEAVFQVGKPVVTVVIAGRPYGVEELCQKSAAALYAFYPGPMGGQAIAEILTGVIAPSGRLPASLPSSAGELPCYYNYKASYTPGGKPQYPFGFGMTYTDFVLADLAFPTAVAKQALLDGASVSVRFTLENTGEMGACAVPQLFLRDRLASTVRRVKELKAFQKVYLRPGEKSACTLTLDREAFSLWDTEMNFVVEPGWFDLYLEEGGKLWAQGQLEIQ